MNNSITWVKASKIYHDKTPELLVPWCTSLINQLVVDTDVPVSGIPLPLTPTIYRGMISDLNTDVVARQNSRAITLTSDELHKGSILLHNTDILVGYIDSVLNQKFQGDITHIETVLARFGLTPVGHGGSHKHIFRVLRVGPKSATLETPTEGAGSLHHFRWSINPSDPTKWTQVKSTYKAIVVITNLPSDVRVYFEYDFSAAVAKGQYPVVSANADDFHWSSAISEVIPASTTTGNTPHTSHTPPSTQ